MTNLLETEFIGERVEHGWSQSRYTYVSPNQWYRVIGDCHSVVLVAPDGSVDWGCLPDFDSPAIFCRLLDAERGGYFQIAPTEGTIPGTQRYLRESNVLQTKFASISGEVVLTDFMPVQTLSAWPRQDDSYHCLVQAVECTRGEMLVTLALKVSPNYAASPSAVWLAPQNTGAVISGGDQHAGHAIVGAYRVSAIQWSGKKPGNLWRHRGVSPLCGVRHPLHPNSTREIQGKGHDNEYTYQCEKTE